MTRLRARLDRVAGKDVTVLITGETGTGKSTAARLLHARSRRREGPYVAVNCPGIPETLMESELFGHERGAFTGAVSRREGLLAAAHGGTLVLDEIGELSQAQQAKLLTVLEDREIRPVGTERSRPVDLRVVAATSRELAEAVREGGFRSDLFHRIAVVRLHIPPLRARPEDIPPMVRHYLETIARRHDRAAPKLTGEGMADLVRRPWPGNVRELVHVLEAALVLTEGPTLGIEDFEAALPPAEDPEPPSRYAFYGKGEAERARIRDALVRWRGNRTRAARALGMSRATLRRRIRKYGLEE